jgi:hypothetical protein
MPLEPRAVLMVEEKERFTNFEDEFKSGEFAAATRWHLRCGRRRGNLNRKIMVVFRIEELKAVDSRCDFNPAIYYSDRKL